MIFEFKGRLPRQKFWQVHVWRNKIDENSDVKIRIFGLILPHKESPNLWHFTQTENWTFDWVLMNITSVCNSSKHTFHKIFSATPIHKRLCTQWNTVCIAYLGL